MKKYFVLLGILFSTINLIAQTDSIPNSSNDKTVTITVTGQGKTIDEAKTNALRSAIEQAFGAFISSNTTILNDNLVKDEIVSVANGNIQKFEILNQTILPDGSNIATLKATVSVNKLTSFCVSKGVKVEFKGGLFAMNIAIQELNDKSELIAWENTKKIIDELIPNCFEYKIKVEDPILFMDTKYNISTTIDVEMNQNYQKLIELLLNFSKSISLTKEEKDYYLAHGKWAYELLFDTSFIYINKIKETNRSGNNFDNLTFLIPISFRNLKVYNEILNLPLEIANKCLVNFQINNGIDTFDMDKFLKRKLYYNPNQKADGQSITLSKKNQNLFDWVNCFDKSALGENILEEVGYNLYPSLPSYVAFDNNHGNGYFYTYKDYSKDRQNLDSVINPLYRNSNYSYFDYNDGKVNGGHFKCLLFHSLNELMTLQFKDLRDISEIKNITEYKIEIKK